MSSSSPFRKSPAHPPPLERHDRPTILFITVCSHGRKNTFANAIFHETLKAVWQKIDFWRVGRYLIMPDHIHFFCAPGFFPAHPLRSWMSAWRRAVSCKLGAGKGVTWQKDFWDTQIRSGADYSEKIAYVASNPVRRNLITDPNAWPYQGEINVLFWGA